MRLLAVTMMAGVAALAQSQPAFEVASVKMTPASNAGYSTFSPYGKGRFTVTKVTLQLLICLAFDVDETQIIDAPGWLTSQNYDVDAKPEEGVNLSYEELKPRLQKLLAQRFKLTFHTQMHDVVGYALVVAKGGPKLQPSTVPEPSGANVLPNGLRNPNANMEMLAAMLTRPVHRPVVDQTGIQGGFDIKLDYAPEGATDSSLPTIFTALQEKLGLRLENRKVPQEMLVIEHVERVPADN
jgi:uncharacterized protein (TIGR03435 family)